MGYRLILTPRRHPSPSGVCGFTGTSRAPGMRGRQRNKVRDLLYNVSRLHLGDCIYADEQAYQEALRLGITTIGHPPEERSRRAFCLYDEEREPRPYLDRNRDIVAESEGGLIAAPNSWVEVMRGSGTWATIRYARKAHRQIWLVLPDGTLIYERNAKEQL